MQELFDRGSFDGTIANGSTETIEVETQRAERVVVLVDSGVTDSVPSEYKLTQRLFVGSFNEFQFYDEVVSETSRSWVDEALGQRMEFEFTNSSGSDAQYRITVLTYKNS